MNITVSHHGSTVVLELSGRLTIGRGDSDLRQAIDDAIAANARSIVLDAAGVSLLDSSGAGELVAAHKLLQSLGGRLSIARMSPKVGGVLVATRLSGVLDLHDSLEGALLDLAA